MPANAIPLHRLKKLPLSFRESFDLFYWDREEEPYDASCPHRHGFHELLFFFEGNAVHEIDSVVYTAGSPCVFFVQAGQVHLVTGRRLYGCSLVFEHDLLNLLTRRFFPSTGGSFIQLWQTAPCLNFSEPLFGEVKELLQQIFNTLSLPGEQNKLMLLTRLEMLLLLLWQHMPAAQTPALNSEHRYELFLQLVEQHWQQHAGITEYAAMLNITPGYLNKIVRQYLGKTASEVIAAKLVTEAKRLLTYTVHSVKEIAYQLNFEDPAYFIRFFKKNTGFTPKDFRNKEKSRDLSCF
ncbi:MAG: helix-turn-helix domain-containing protein [Dinghuibacter sp.]|nr:helix-turn-helix domain-containing protein [Dinghuibacter sp.]